MNNTIALIILVLMAVVFCVAIIWMVIELWIVLTGGAPYVGTKRIRIERMLRLAGLKSEDRAIDLGSGDGRIVIAAAKQGIAISMGIERHPGLVWKSRLWAWVQGVRNARFDQGDLWKTDLSQVDVVFLYQLPKIMIGLEKKLFEELPSGARIISACFQFTDHAPFRQEVDVYLYEKL